MEKTNNQVEVIVFKKAQADKYVYLLFKRVAAKGGFWQPITGNVLPHEEFSDAARRELYEEAGVKEPVRLFDVEHEFTFFDDGRLQREKVFAAEVSEATQIRLSSEHDECRWESYDEAINKFLKYPGNKEAIGILDKYLRSKR